METQIVAFELGSEYYGMEIAKVESIIKMPPITSLPHTSHIMEGVTNLRGKVLPVINLRKRFGLPAREADKNSRIIVVNLGQNQAGMIVDSVSEVLTVPEGTVEAAPTITSTIDSNFITGIARLDQHLVILLDAHQVLTNSQRLSLPSQ